MKKFLALALSGLFLLGAFAACSQNGQSSQVEAAAGAYTPGTYTSTQEGHNGPVTVEVTFDANSITKVEVTEHEETAGVADPALERIPAAVVDGQTLAVDTVSGATVTSSTLLAAIEDCVVQAGGDVDALKQKGSDNAERTAVERTEEVLVIGTGIAGMMAAISAADAGAKVLAIDKMPATGGTTITAGAYFIAVDSELDNEGVVDGIDNMMAYWHDLMDQGEDTGYPDYDRVENVLGASGKTIDYMKAEGVPFGDSVVNVFGAYPVAIVDGGGSALIASLEETARSKGVEFLLECTAEELILEDGKVVGVKATTATEEITFHTGSVVLATGGFSKNAEMVTEYSPEIVDVVSLAAVGSTGDGIRMAEAAGAARFDNYWSALSSMALSGEYTRAVPEASALRTPAQLGVNAKGERYANENPEYWTSLSYDSIKDGEFPHYFLFDTSDEELVAALEAGIDLGEVFKGETIAELAKAALMDEATLEATVESYNAMAKAGSDTQFGKDAELLVPLAEDGPYYAVIFYPTTFGSTGGVKTEVETGAVLDTAGAVIPGLYAAGEMSNRDFYNQHYALAASLGFYSTMGYRAGIAAADYAA